MNRLDREARGLDAVVLGLLVVVALGACVALGVARLVLEEPHTPTSERP